MPQDKHPTNSSNTSNVSSVPVIAIAPSEESHDNATRVVIHSLIQSVVCEGFQREQELVLILATVAFQDDNSTKSSTFSNVWSVSVIATAPSGESQGNATKVTCHYR